MADKGKWRVARQEVPQVGSQGCILTPVGDLVARTTGCTPMMELPDALPHDIDYDWYVREAESLLCDIGVVDR